MKIVVRTFLALCCACVASAGGAMLNVLDLGAKNDGSADISEIVNAHTAKGALFFPAGLYKVAKPLWLKNPVCGEGYARVPQVNGSRTWFLSEIACTNGSIGVVNFGGDVQVNVEKIAIRCKSRECGIRIGDCRQGTPTFISQVGIFDMRSHGLCVIGGGSRPIFAQDMTVFGARDYPVPCVGIRLQGAVDCRLSNIEVMGARIGLEVYNGYTYANNLHLWTGPMAGKDNGSWWMGTRGIVLGPQGVFAGSEIYPDTCFYAIEQKDARGAATIHNLMYWEDGSTKGAPDRNGAFFHAPDGVQGTLTVHGGLVGVGGTDGREGWMRHVYSPGQTFDGVLIKSDYALTAANLDRLCLGGTLPDYSVRYAETGWCRVADICTAGKTGACSGILALDDGAAWRVTCTKGRDGRVSTTAKSLNALAEDGFVKAVEESGMVRVFLRREMSDPVTARFTTSYMGARFRPLDHGALRDKKGNRRHHEVRKKVE